MRIAITGGLGHIGSFVVPYLINQPAVESVCVFDNMTTQRYPVIFSWSSLGNIKFVEKDCRQIIAEDLESYDGVIHLAALTNAESSASSPEVYISHNTELSNAIALAAEDAGCWVLFASSTSVYGSAGEVNETSPLNPQSPYAESKILEEQIFQASGCNNVIARFGTIVGFSCGMRFHTAVNKFCWQASAGQPISVWQTAANQVRPYLSLSDAASAIFKISVVLNASSNVAFSDVVNVVSRNSSVNEILTILTKHIPKLEIAYVSSEIMNQLSYDVCGLRGRARYGLDYKNNIEWEVEETLKNLSALRNQI